LANRKVRRGRPRITTSQGHRAAYDKRFWKGFSRRLLEDGKCHSHAQLLEKYGARTGWTTRQAVSRALAVMSGGKQKPWVRGKIKMKRPDVTVNRIRKLAKIFPSVIAIARACGTFDETVRARAKQGRFSLPDGSKMTSCDIPLHHLRQRARQGENATIIGKRFGYWSGTVTLYAKRHGIRLQNGSDARLARALRRRQKAWRLRMKKGTTIRKIALLLGVHEKTIQKDLRRHRYTPRERRLAS
jgi:hypothetical protein